MGSASEVIESPYNNEARYRRRGNTTWTGFIVHVRETSDDDTPNLLTKMFTNDASVHEARCTAQIQQALVNKRLAPGQHRVDAANVGADLLVSSKHDQSITLVGQDATTRTGSQKSRAPMIDTSLISIGKRNRRVAHKANEALPGRS